MTSTATSKSISNNCSESTITPHNRMVLSPLLDSNENQSNPISSSSNGHEKFYLARDNLQENMRTQMDNGATTSEHCITSDTKENVIEINDIYKHKNAQVSDTIDSDNEEMIMSVYWRNGKLGAAYYNTVSSELYSLNEIVDSKPEHSMLRNLYRQVQPVAVIIDTRTQKTFSECLKSLVIESDSDTISESGTNENSRTRTKIHFLPNEEYNFESCKRRIYLLRLPNEPADSSDDDHHIFLHSIINFHCTQTVHALGALLKYLDKYWCRLDIDENATPSFLTIKTISLHKIVTMNDESYKALQVFNKLSHPSNFKKGTANSGKEGLSLFGIFNRCNSKIGMQHLKVMLQHPTNDKKILEGRLDTIAFLNKPGNEEIVKNISTSLRHIKNVNGLMTRIKGLRASPYEWKSLFNTLCNGILVCEFCEKCQGNSPLIDALGSRNNYDLFQVVHHMKRVVDFDLSKAQGKFTVNLGIDPDLDFKKQNMTSIHGLMSSAAKLELEKLPVFIEECTMVYLPNLGYLLGVKAWEPNLSREAKEIPDLRFMFQNHDYIHYKSKGCEELDYLIGDTQPEILAHEMRIMMRLTKFILQHLQTLSAVIKLCAELDCLVAIARTCKDNDYKRPILTTEKIINIKNGRHPLQELVIDNYVPNSTKSSSDSNLVTILTGPNSSGKSIYLKQVALIVYMAHIGCFVPAESASIGLIDHIFTRVQTVEDISTRMSAFLIDLSQMSLAIQESTSNSLIIIDEFGKGTSEVDGLALLAACIHNFLYRKDNIPHMLVSTHFQTIAQYFISQSKPCPYLKFQTLEHCIQDKELVFLYKLTDGVAESSLAHQVAESVGIESSNVKRAKYIFECLQLKVPSPDETLIKYKTHVKIIKSMKTILDDKHVTKSLVNRIFKPYN